MVYNGSFFYLNLESESVVRYDLLSMHSRKFRIPRNRVVRHSGLKLLSNRLYAPQQEYSYVDFATDENGIWAIMGLAVDNNTVVMKFDAATLQIQYMWNISLSHHQVADMFIVCGVLYAVDHVDLRETKIRYTIPIPFSYYNIHSHDALFKICIGFIQEQTSRRRIALYKSFQVHYNFGLQSAIEGNCYHGKACIRFHQNPFLESDDVGWR